MQWTLDAENALKKVPFFVRKRVRARVEKEAHLEGKSQITLTEVNATQQRYLKGMASEIKGYQLDTCFGPTGCPNQVQPGNTTLEKVETLLKTAGLLDFLKASGVGELKFHHEFRVSIADCPNACSQPQIKDIGIIGASRPRISDAPCSQCDACESVCREKAIAINDAGPAITWSQCVNCGQCLIVCPTGTLIQGPLGYRVYLGGKLGRHPRLALPLPGIYSQATVLDIVQACIDLYKSKSTQGQRFADILSTEDFAKLAEAFRHRRIDNE